jgi:azurin
MRNLTSLLFVALALSSAACGKTESSPTPAPSAQPASTGVAPQTSAAPVASASAAPAAEPAQEVILNVNNDMKFDKTMLMVKAGAKVHVVVKSTATMPTMPHNWVLVKPGTEAQVALDGLNKAPDAGYVAPADASVLAFTPLAGPGGTAEVTFTAPAAGKYPYICTVPGHYITMKGVLMVSP